MSRLSPSGFSIYALIAIIGFASLFCVQSQNVAPQSPLWNEIIESFNNFSRLPNAGLTIGRRDVGVILNITKGNWSFVQPTLVASASKLMSSMAIWTLIQDGSMSLNDNPWKYIPWWSNDTTGDSRARVTLAQLLAFTSGFNGEYSCPGMTMEECVQTIYDGGVASAPGTTYHYAGDHLQVAGLMAIKAGGYSNWVELFNARVKNPTGTTDSVVWTPAGSTNSRVAGGMLTSANTYIQMFMGFYMPTLFNATTLELMQMDRTGPGVTIEFRPPGVGEIGQDWHYCASFWYECPFSTFNSTCADQRVFSSPGAFGFTPSVDRVNDYWMVVSQYQLQGAPDAIAWTTPNRDAVARIIKQLYPSAPVRAPANPPSASPASAPAMATSPSTTIPTSVGAAPSSGSTVPSATATPKTSSAHSVDVFALLHVFIAAALAFVL